MLDLIKKFSPRLIKAAAGLLRYKTSATCNSLIFSVIFLKKFLNHNSPLKVFSICKSVDVCFVLIY